MRNALGLQKVLTKMKYKGECVSCSTCYIMRTTYRVRTFLGRKEGSLEGQRSFLGLGFKIKIVIRLGLGMELRNVLCLLKSLQREDKKNRKYNLHVQTQDSIRP